MLTNLLIQIISLIGGGIGGAITQVTNMIKSGFQAAVKFHQEGIAFARNLGMSAKEAQAYTEVLTNRTAELANKYGVAAEEIIKIQKGLADATGRQIMLSNADHERFLQIQKLVGDQTLNKFTEQLMTKMGGQLQTVQGAVSKAYATAAKSGLNAAKFSDKVAQNLSLANKLTFKNGVDGIAKMTALSEKLGFNLQSVEKAADKFLDLDQAISSSANLQMLGGAAGAFGSNPLTMAYEANYDMEAFTERMTKMLGGYATFDAAKGISNVNGMNRDFVKAIADALGMGMDEAMTIAKKQAEIKYKENTFGAAIAKYGTENQDFLMNRSYVKDRQLMMTDMNGNEINISNGELTKDIIDQLKKFDNTSEKQIMEQQALTLTSINEQLSGLGASFAASFAKYLNGVLPGLTTDIKSFGAWAIKEMTPVAKDIGKATSEIVAWVKTHGSEIKSTLSTIASSIRGFVSFATEHWKLTLAAIVGFKALKMIGGLPVGANQTLGGNLGRNALRGIWSSSRDMNIATRLGYQESRNLGSGRFASALKAPFKGFTALSGAQKLAVGGTALAGIGIAATQGILAQSSYKKRLEEINNSNLSDEEKAKAISEAKTEKNSSIGGAIGSGVGTAIGTALGGPIGAMIGGAIGQFAGGYIGKNWNKITDVVSKGWSKVVGGFSAIGDWFKSTWSKYGDKIIDGILLVFAPWGLVIRHWDEVSQNLSNTWNATIGALSAAGNYIKNKWDSFTNGVSDFVGGIENWFKEKFDGAVSSISSIGDWFKNKWDGAISAVGSVGNWFKSKWDDTIKFFRNIGEGIAKTWAAVCDAVGTLNPIKWAEKLAQGAVETIRGYDSGGIVGGESYSGDKLLARLNSSEMILNKNQQGNLFSFIDNLPKIFGNTNDSTINNTSSSILNNIINGGSMNYLSNATNYGGNTLTTNAFNPVTNGGIKNLITLSTFGDSRYSSVSNESASRVSNSPNFIYGGSSNTNNGGTSNVAYYTATSNGLVGSGDTINNNLSNALRNLYVGGNTYNNSVGGVSNVSASNSFGGYTNNNAYNTNLGNVSSLSSNSFIGGNIGGNTYNSSIGGVSNALSSNSFIGGNDLSNTSIASASNSENSSVSNVMSTVFRNPSNIMASALELNSDLKTVPFGGESFKELPRLSQAASQDSAGVKDVHVNDINVNISGTIKLDGGNMSKDIDINKLLGNSDFVSKLKSIIEESINREANGGRLSSHWSYSR